MINLCTIVFNTHSVQVRQNEDGPIHVFKYTDSRCEMETFDNREDAEEYVLCPFSSVDYSLVIHDDE
jgi:hypothetical protein